MINVHINFRLLICLCCLLPPFLSLSTQRFRKIEIERKKAKEKLREILSRRAH